jgi:hypothetical protein
MSTTMDKKSIRSQEHYDSRCENQDPRVESTLDGFVESEPTCT